MSEAQIHYQSPVLNIEGKALTVPKRNGDGEIDWEKKPDPVNEFDGIPKLKDADTLDLLDVARRRVDQAWMKADDSQHMLLLFQQVEEARAALAAKDAPQVVGLTKAVYEWLARLLDRIIPLTKEARDSGLESQRYSLVLWGANEYVIRQALLIKVDETPKE